MIYYFGYKRGFFTLIGLLLAAVIIFVLVYYAFQTYFNEPSFDESSQQSIIEQGIDVSSYQSVLGSTREKVKDIESQMLDRSKYYDGTNK